MRRFFSLLCVVILGSSLILGLTIGEAQAKRFGGGRSFGVQRTMTNNSSFSRPQSSAFSSQRPSMAKRWLGPLAGLVAGGLLASLFMGHGIGSGILSWLLVGSIIFLLWNFIRNKSRTAFQTTSHQYSNHTDTASPTASSFNSYANHQAAPANMMSYPTGFHAENFLRDAKVQFIRLQAAYDNKNLNDLREFTTPEVFAEIQMQLHERGDQANQTEVVTLDAELLDATTEFQVMVASVRFSGLIREDHQAAAPFNEMWHFRKDDTSQRWMVSGIEQK